MDYICPYFNCCIFRNNNLGNYEKFCKEDFTTCARFKCGCSKGFNAIPDDMSIIDCQKI